jgi:hypothetical protein
MLVRLLLLFASFAPAAPANDLRSALLAHAQRYPAWEVQDCYKFVFHAVRGAEHAAPSEQTAREWLEREIATMGEAPVDEPLVEPLGTDGNFVRVHLRPFVQRGGDLPALARAFVATAQRGGGASDEVAAAWEQVIACAASGRLPVSAEAARDFGARMKAAGFPAARHSETFRRAYRPAYRVIARELLESCLPREAVTRSS